MMQTACPLCGETRSVLYLQCPDNLATSDIFTIVRCEQCQCLYTSDEPGIKGISAYYTTQEYESLSGSRSGLRATIRKIRQGFAARFVERHAKRRGGTILDIGCGTGDFLDVMAKRGWGVSGIEPDTRCREKICSRGINVMSPADITSIPDASADVITLWHVLEHVHGLLEFGQQLHRILKPDGVIIIAVPNANAFDARLYGKDWHGYELPRHLYHFTRESLTRFALTSGFTTVRLGTMPLDSLYCCLQTEKYLNGSPLRGMLRALLTMTTATIRPTSSTTILAVLRRNR